MSKQKKRFNILKIVLAVAVVVLLLEVALLFWLQKKQEDIPNETEAAEITEPPKETEVFLEPTETEQQILEETTPVTVPAKVVETLVLADGQIETPFFVLHYPEELSDLLAVVKTAEDPFTLEFYAMLEDKPEQRIFDIQLSESAKGNMGVVKTESANVYVDLTFYKFDPDDSWTKDEVNTVLAMQEAANDMISKLGLEEDASGQANQPAVEETVPESSVVNMLSVNTPYCSLRFPVRWKDYLVTEHAENEETGVYSVLFYGKIADQENCLLFTILFGGDEGDQLGVVLLDSGEYITVNVLVEELNLDGWNEEDMQIVCTMQEAVNELIAQLPVE